MTARAALILAALLGLTAPARADQVELVDGRVLEGVVEDVPGPAGELVVRVRHGAVHIARADVRRIVRRETPEQELVRRIAALPPDDPVAALDLGRFCVTRGFEAEARALAAHVARLAPERAAELYQALDHHLVDGRWVAPETWYPAQGWERISGRWLPPEESRLVHASRGHREAGRAIEAARRASTDARDAALEARRALDRSLRRLDHLHAARVALDSQQAAAAATLDSRQRDLDAAEQSLALARERFALWALAQRGAQGGWSDPRAAWVGSCWTWDQGVAGRRAERDRALAEVQRLAEVAARLPGELAQALAAERDATLAFEAAEDAAEAGEGALARVEAAARDAELELGQAKVARDAARR